MPWYEVRVEGRLDPAAGPVPGFRVVDHVTVTVLYGHVERSADLPVLMAAVDAQGLKLTEVHQVSGGDSGPAYHARS